MVRDAMHLAFLLARRWPPYPKWLGTAFSDLPTAGALGPRLAEVLALRDWSGRQAAIARALAVLHESQRVAGLPTIEAGPTERFFDRPFLGVRSSVEDLLLAAVEDPSVRALPAGIGSVEQCVDNVSLLLSPPDRVRLIRSVLIDATARLTG
jgi:hypothetical protein